MAIVLHLPEAEVGAGTAYVRLTSERGKARASATATAEGTGVRVEAELPAKRVPPGLWTLAVRLGDEAPFRPVRARLLTSRTQPIALLIGPAGQPGITPPPPHGRRRQVVAQGGRILDRALSPLPPAQAKRCRSALRKAARTVLR